MDYSSLEMDFLYFVLQISNFQNKRKSNMNNFKKNLFSSGSHRLGYLLIIAFLYLSPFTNY